MMYVTQLLGIFFLALPIIILFAMMVKIDGWKTARRAFLEFLVFALVGAMIGSVSFGTWLLMGHLEEVEKSKIVEQFK